MQHKMKSGKVIFSDSKTENEKIIDDKIQAIATRVAKSVSLQDIYEQNQIIIDLLRAAK